MDKTIARAAGHCGEAFSLLSAWSGDAVRSMIDSNENSLQLAKLAQYNHEQRRWLLREWFATMNLKPPSQALLQTINQQLITARDDADPQIMVQGRYLKKYRQRLYCLHAHQLQKITADLPWEPGKSSLELGNGYRLTLLPSSAGIAQRLWDRANVTASPRRGGEKFKLPGRNGRHCLKKLYQEAGIPPWERESRPLVYLDGQLAAVPDLWLSEWACANETEACYQLIWEYAGSRN